MAKTDGAWRDEIVEQLNFELMDER